MFGSRRRAQVFSVRIGLLRDGRLVEERVFSPRDRVVVGTDGSCSFRCAEGPVRHTLLSHHRGAWRLHPAAGLDVRVAQRDASPVEVREAVVVGPGDRARVRAGELTLLIQRMAAQVDPALLRPQLIEADDVPFVASLNTCAAFGAALILWTLSAPVVADTRIEKAHTELIARLVMPPRLPEPPAPTIELPADAPVARAVRREDPAPSPRRSAEDDARALENDPLLAAIRLLGSRDGRKDIFAEEDPSLAGVQQALDKVDGTHQVNLGGPQLRAGQRQGDRDIAELDKARINATTLDAGPRAFIPDFDSVQGPTSGTTSSLQAEAVAVVKAGFGGLRACYERALTLDPTLSGRVELAWDVQDGRVIRAMVVDNTTGDDELGRCMTDRVRGWRFEASTNGSVEFPFMLTAKE